VATFATVDQYIASFPPDVQRTLEDVRGAMRAVLPGTDERISYGIPTFTFDGRYVVYFSGWKRHVSVYPIPDTRGDPAFERELKPFMAGKGTLKFALDRPIPIELIGRVAQRLLEQRKARR
jgi:uncharacterized protein YdhG (YjbR/CyaY superfamily)